MADLHQSANADQLEAGGASSPDREFDGAECGNATYGNDTSSADRESECTESGNATCGSDTNENTDIEDNDQPIPIRELLESQKAGEFDFDRSPIRDFNDFHRLRHEYETMDDKPRPDPTVRADAPTLRQHSRRLAKAIPRMDRAVDIENATNASSALNHLNRLKSIEVEIKTWEALLAARDAQQGRVGLGVFGNTDIPPSEHYNSLGERVGQMENSLELSKNLSRKVFTGGPEFLKRFAASPAAMLKRHVGYKQSNLRRAAAKKSEGGRKDASSTQPDPSRPLNATQPPAEAFGTVPGKMTAQAHESRPTRGGRQGSINASPSSSTAEKKKQPSAAPGRPQAEPRNAEPTVPNDGETSLAAPGGGTQSTESWSRSMVERGIQDDIRREYLWELARSYATSREDQDPANSTTSNIRPPAGADGSPLQKGASSSAVSTPTSDNSGREQHETRSVYFDPATREAIATLRGRKFQPKPSAVNPFIPESVRLESSTPLVYPPPPAHYSGTLNSAKKRPSSSVQLPEGPVKRQKRDTTRDDTHPSERNRVKAALGGNKKPAGFPSHDLTKASSESANSGLTGRQPLPEYPGHRPQRRAPAARESTANSTYNVISLQPVLHLRRSNAGQRPGQSSRAPTNSLSAAANLPPATTQPFRGSGGLSLPAGVRGESDAIAPSVSRYPDKKKKRSKNSSSQPQDGASRADPGSAATRYRKIRKQDGKYVDSHQDDYAEEGDEE